MARHATRKTAATDTPAADQKKTTEHGRQKVGGLDLSVIAQRDRDFQERSEAASLLARQRNADAAFDKLESMTERSFTRQVIVKGKPVTKTITQTITPDMRLVAEAVINAYPTTTPPRGTGRVQAAVDQVSLELTDEMFSNEKRKKQAIAGFYLARTLLQDAFKAHRNTRRN